MDESALTKGQLRKLNALKKSVGDDIGTKAFSKWLNKFGFLNFVSPKNLIPPRYLQRAKSFRSVLEVNNYL